MTDDTEFVHSDPERLPRQEMAFRAVINRLIDESLQAFATKASAVVLRGLAFDAGLREGISEDELARMLGQPVPQLIRLMELAFAYKDAREEELYKAAVWAYVRGELPLPSVNASLENGQGLLEVLGRGGSLAQLVKEWTERKNADGLPTSDSIVYHLGGDLGGVIDKYTYPEIACHLAYGFKEDQMSVALAEDIVTYYWGHRLTPALAYEIAVEAINQARKLCESASAKENPPAA